MEHNNEQCYLYTNKIDHGQATSNFLLHIVFHAIDSSKQGREQ